MNAPLMSLGGWQPLVDAPVWAVLLAKVTVVLAAAWLAHGLLARWSPRWRVLLWRATAVGLVALPAVAWLVPALEIRVPQPPPAEAAPLPTAIAMPSADPVAARRAAVEVPNSATEPRAVHLAPPESTERSQTAGSLPLPQPQAPAPAPPRSWSVSWPAVLLAVWLGGVAVLALRLFLGHWRICRIVRRGHEPPPWLRDECQRVAQGVGCRARVDVVPSTFVGSPLLCGLRRPVLLLPARMGEDACRGDLPGILAHELTHIRCHDLAWNLGLHLLSVMLWFHPLAWRLRRAHLTACELVCDAASAAFVGNAAEYCRTLARVAVGAVGSLPAAGIAMARTSSISLRLSVLKKGAFHAPLGRRSVIAFGMAATLSVAMLGVLRFALAEPSPDKSAAAAEKTEAEPPRKDAGPAENASAEKPGFRPMRIAVLDSDRKPIVDAGITVRGMTSLPFGPVRYRTDGEGNATIDVPKADVKDFQILVWDDKHVTAGASWHGDGVAAQVPEAFTFALKSGTILGGVIHDERGQPIVGADVTVEGRRTSPGVPLWVSINDTAKTDAEGKWQVHRVPKDLAGFDLAVTVKRPDVAGVERFDAKALPIDKLRDQTAVLVLRKGIALEGTVTDPQGKPAVGAAVGLFSERTGGDFPRTKTGQNGRYRFAVSEPGEYTLAAAAQGYAPDSRRVTVATQPQVIDLHLRNGEMIRLRVLDKEGQPMQGVAVSTVFNNEYRDALMLDYQSSIERDKDRHMTTDAEGRWSRLWIPKDPLTFLISTPGYARVEKKIAPGEPEQIVTLEAGGWSVSGRVVDRETKAPITKFRVAEGSSHGGGDRDMTWSQSRIVEEPSGQFRASWDTSGDSRRVLRIEADGYLPSEPRRLLAHQRQVTFDVELSKGQEIVGVVRSADGKPLADAEVALCTATRGLYLKNGRPLEGQPHLIVRTGADGRFSFSPQRDIYFLVVLHDQGFAQVEDVAGMKEITVQPWAKVDGTLRIDNKPGAQESITIDFGESEPRGRNPLPAELDRLSPIEQMVKVIEFREIPLDRIPKETLDQIPRATLDRLKQRGEIAAIARRIHFDYQTRTDAEGHFVFDRVRPGKAKIGRYVKIAQEGQMSSWMMVNRKSVEFVPGQTLSVALSGDLDPSAIRQRERAAARMARTIAASGKKSDDTERETRVESAMKVLYARPRAAEEARIEAALEVVRNHSIGKNERSWATAIRELVTIGKPAVPKLIAQLDGAERDGTLRALGFVLRGIGDPRAVPALIRAIPRLYPGGGSDCGLTIQDDPDLLEFIQQHDNSTRDESQRFSFGRPIREIMPALEKITGESHGWLELNFADGPGQGAEQDRLKRIAFLKHAERWADWWSKNWQKQVSSEADAQLDQTRQVLDRCADAVSKMPQGNPPSTIPRGPKVVVGGGVSNHVVRSFDEPQMAGLSEGILDLDTGRRPHPPQELVENSPGGEPSKELLAWAAQEGVDLITVKTKLPGSDKPVYAFMPLGMKVWRIENDFHDDLQKELCYGEKDDFPEPWTGLIAQTDVKSGKFDDALTASYLFITKEGICGALQIQSPVSPELAPGTPAPRGGGWRYQFIYERNPEE